MLFSIIIPTRNRETDLMKCIRSVVNQTVLPEEVIIIDDGNIGNVFVSKIQLLLNNLNIIFKYCKKNKPGQSASKNIGIKKSSSNIALFLDDDVVLEKNYIELIKKEWMKYGGDPRLVGIGGIIKNFRHISFLEKIFNKIFCLSSSVDWDITSVGFQVWNPSIKKSKKAFYLSGGISSFRKKIIEKIPFRALNPGRTVLEDVDFCLRAKSKGYYFRIVPEAKVFHKQSKVSRDSDFITGEKETYNRRIIYKDNVKKTFINRIKFIWSNIGWILRQFLGSHFSKGFGMIKGLFKKNEKNYK